jgi:FtsZ-interacting cell division protein ZipA
MNWFQDLQRLYQSSDLTVALAVLGAVVLIILVAQSLWISSKSKPKNLDDNSEKKKVPPWAAVSEKRTEPLQAPQPIEPDFLKTQPVHLVSESSILTEPVLTSEQLAAVAEEMPDEPSLNSQTPAETVAPARSQAPVEALATTVTPAAVPVVPKRPSVRVDALIDAVAVMQLSQPITGNLVLPNLPTTRRAGSKLFLIEGLNVTASEWEPVQAHHTYQEFQAGVQLANRVGALNEIEYSEFVHKVQVFADALGVMPDIPDMSDVVARAKELDLFASQHDAQLAVHLRAQGSAWSIGFVAQHAKRCGFIPSSVAGRWVMPSSIEGSPPVLLLTFDDQTASVDDPNEVVLREVMLSFDVPQTEESVQPFVAWQTHAQALSEALDAVITDDQGAQLNSASFAAIGSELRQLYKALEVRDVAAGSAAARRLFS